MSQYFEKPKFQDIVQYYLNWSCDMESQLDKLQRDNHNNCNHKNSMAELTKTLNNIPNSNPLPASLRKNMRLIIIEMIPSVLVSDGHNFIEAIFTKESINDLRKYHSHVKFSNLRDKIIQVNKWSLQVDCVDSREVFNSYQNLTIKLVIEQFKPQMHEILNQRLTHGATSIFRNSEIQTLIRNYRHWFAQTMIYKNAVSAEASSMIVQGQGGSSGQQITNIVAFDQSFDIPPMPSLSEITANNSDLGQINQRKTPGKNTRGSLKFSSTPASNNGSSKRKTMQQFMQITQNSHNSQNTTQLSDNDQLQGESLSQQNFGAIIQKSQVFRCKVQDFQNFDNLKFDSYFDLPDFKEQVQLKKSLQSKELREADIERIVIQEKGEQYYAEKKFNKSRQWQEQVEDEYRREQLKIQIEYFQVGEQKDKIHSHYQSIWQRDEKEKALKRASGGYRSSRRIVGYTLGFSAASIKEKLVKMLVHSKYNQQTESASKSVCNKSALSPPKGGGRQRANSQENILQIKDPEDGKTQMQCHQDLSREPLSQFVVNQNSVFNDDTQSEQDSIDAQITHELTKERESPNKLDDVDRVMEATQPILNSSISLFREYLDWFQQKGNDLEKVLTENEIREQEIALQQKREQEAKEAEAAALEAENYAPRKSNRLKNKMQTTQRSSQPPQQDAIMTQSLHDEDEDANPIAATLANEQVFDNDEIMRDEPTPLIDLADNHQILQSHSNENDIIQIQEESHELTEVREMTPLPLPAGPTATENLTLPVVITETNTGTNNVDLFLNDIQENEDMLQLDDNTQNNDSNNLFSTSGNQYNMKNDEEFQSNHHNQQQYQNPPNNFSNVINGQNLIYQQNAPNLPMHLNQPHADVVDVVLQQQQLAYGTPEKRNRMPAPPLNGQDDDCIAYMQISDKKPINSDQVSIKSEPNTDKQQDPDLDQKVDDQDEVGDQKAVQDESPQRSPRQEKDSYATPTKQPVLDVEFRFEPPKPLDQMTPGEKAMFELEKQYAMMQAEMERQQQVMQDMMKQKAVMQQKIQEEAERKEKEEQERLEKEEQERLEQERLERERLEQERLECERMERERQEQERIEQERQERLEQERLEKERLERERLEREKIQREEQERQEQLEKERKEQEEKERAELATRSALEEKIKREQERRRLERMTQQKEIMLKAINNWCLEMFTMKLQEQQVRIQEEARLKAEADQRLHEEQRAKMELEKKRKKEEEQLKVQQEIQARIEKERKAQEEMAKQHEMNQCDDLDWGEGSNDDDDEIDGQQENEEAPEENQFNQQQEDETFSEQNDQENQEELDQEYNYEDMDAQKERLDQQRNQFVSKMSQKFEGVLNKEIRRNETKDLNRRKIKRDENDDKLYDFMKIQNIKKEKLGASNRFRGNHEQMRPQSQMLSGQQTEFGNAQDYNQNFQQITLENDQVDELDAQYLNANQVEDHGANMNEVPDEQFENVEDQYNMFDPLPSKEQMNQSNENPPDENDHQQQQQATESYSDIDEDDVQFHETIQPAQPENLTQQQTGHQNNDQQQLVVEILSEENDDHQQETNHYESNEVYNDDIQEIAPHQFPEQEQPEVVKLGDQQMAQELQSPSKTIQEVQAYTELPKMQSQGHQQAPQATPSTAQQSMTQNTVAQAAQPNMSNMSPQSPAGAPTNMDAISALQAQIQALTQTVSAMSQQLCSQQQLKQGGGDPSSAESQNQNQQTPGAQDQGVTPGAGEAAHTAAANAQNPNEYHVPVFGSQLKQEDPAGPATNPNAQTQQDSVKPFTLKAQAKKRNHTQQQQTQYQQELPDTPGDDQLDQEQHGYKAQRAEGDDKVDKQTNYGNLEEFINFQRMKNHKAKIIQEFNKRDQASKRQRHQIRQDRGPSGPSGQAQAPQNQRPPRHSSQQRPTSNSGSMQNQNYQRQQMRQRGQSQDRSASAENGQNRRVPPQDGRSNQGQHPLPSQQRPIQGRPMGMQPQQRPAGAIGPNVQQVHAHQHGQGYANNGGQGSPQKHAQGSHPGHAVSQGSSPKRQPAPQSQQMQKRPQPVGSNPTQHPPGVNAGYNRGPNPHQMPQQNSRPMAPGGPTSSVRPQNPGTNQIGSSSNMMGGAKRYIHSQQPGQGHLKDPQSAHIQRLYANQDNASNLQQARQQKNMSPRKQFVQNGQYQNQMRQQRNIFNNDEN